MCAVDSERYREKCDSQFSSIHTRTRACTHKYILFFSHSLSPKRFTFLRESGGACFCRKWRQRLHRQHHVLSNTHDRLTHRVCGKAKRTTTPVPSAHTARYMMTCMHSHIHKRTPHTRYMKPKCVACRHRTTFIQRLRMLFSPARARSFYPSLYSSHFSNSFQFDLALPFCNFSFAASLILWHFVVVLKCSMSQRRVDWPDDGNKRKKQRYPFASVIK